MADAAKISRRKRTVFILIALTFFAVLQEVLFRLIFPIPEVLNFNRVNYSMTFLTPKMSSLKYLSNTAFTWISEPDRVESVNVLNLYGFHDKNWNVSCKKGSDRIMFIGDSFLEGFMVTREQTITTNFEKRAHGDNLSLEVLNLGVGASQISEYYGLISDALPLFKPTHLVIVFYANDFPAPPFSSALLRDTLTPKYSHWWMPRCIYVSANILNGKTVPLSWTSKPFPFIASVPDQKNPWSSKEYAAYYERFISPPIADAMKKGQFNPYVVNEYSIYEENLTVPFGIRSHLIALKSFTSQFSTNLSIVYIPSRSQVSDAYLQYQKQYNESQKMISIMSDKYQLHAEILQKTCVKLDIPFLDLTPILRKFESEEKRLFWNYDEHMNADGYSLVGSSIYDWWKKSE